MHAISASIGRASGWLILPLIFTIIFDVVTRKLDVTRLYFSDFTIEYGYSVSTIMQDLEWHFHAVIVMMSFGVGYLMNAHVRVDVFRELVSKRKQAWNEFFLLIVFGLPFLTTLLYYNWTLFHISWLQGEGSDSMTGIDWRWAVKFALPLGTVLIYMATLATLGRLFVYLFGSGAVKDEAESMIQIFSDNHDDLEAIRDQLEHALEDEVKHVHDIEDKGQ